MRVASPLTSVRFLILLAIWMAKGKLAEKGDLGPSVCTSKFKRCKHLMFTMPLLKEKVHAILKVTGCSFKFMFSLLSE